MAKRIKIKVIPRSSRNEIAGVMADGTLKIRLTAVPVDGAANEALIVFLSKVWGVPKQKIRIVRGLKNKIKLLEIGGKNA